MPLWSINERVIEDALNSDTEIFIPVNGPISVVAGTAGFSTGTGVKGSTDKSSNVGVASELNGLLNLRSYFFRCAI